MKSPTPIDPVELIERSVRCFWLGLPGIVPVIGLPFAVAALAEYFRVNRRPSAGGWNPAQNYLRWGSVAALTGILLSLLFVAVVAVSLVTR